MSLSSEKGQEASASMSRRGSGVGIESFPGEGGGPVTEKASSQGRRGSADASATASPQPGAGRPTSIGGPTSPGVTTAGLGELLPAHDSLKLTLARCDSRSPDAFIWHTSLCPSSIFPDPFQPPLSPSTTCDIPRYIHAYPLECRFLPNTQIDFPFSASSPVRLSLSTRIVIVVRRELSQPRRGARYA